MSIGKRDRQERICSEVCLVGCAVEFTKEGVESFLVETVAAKNGRLYRVVDILDGLPNTFAHPSRAVTIAQFNGFVFTS